MNTFIMHLEVRHLLMQQVNRITLQTQPVVMTPHCALVLVKISSTACLLKLEMNIVWCFKKENYTLPSLRIKQKGNSILKLLTHSHKIPQN